MKNRFLLLILTISFIFISGCSKNYYNEYEQASKEIESLNADKERLLNTIEYYKNKKYEEKIETHYIMFDYKLLLWEQLKEDSFISFDGEIKQIIEQDNEFTYFSVASMENRNDGYEDDGLFVIQAYTENLDDKFEEGKKVRIEGRYKGINEYEMKDGSTKEYPLVLGIGCFVFDY